MGRGSRFELVLPHPLMALIRHCETICVADCCGVDAFDRDPKHMLPWLRERQGEFFLVLDQLSDAIRSVGDHRSGVESAHDFNAIWDGPAECSQYLREWRGTILKAAALVYGKLPAIAPAWYTSDVVALARGIYADCAFDRLPILADALQDAGCDCDEILNHCRDMNQSHAHGCWMVDLILGKD